MAATGEDEQAETGRRHRRWMFPLALVAAMVVIGAVSSVVLLRATDDGPPRPKPLPVLVPTAPGYASVDEIAERLEAAGIGCSAREQPSNSLVLTCGSNVREPAYGYMCQFRIGSYAHQKDPARSRDGFIQAWFHTGEIAHYSVTAVAGANWALVTCDAAAERAAPLLGGVIVRGGATIPDYPLPPVPDQPVAASVDGLAERLDIAVGCAQREPDSAGGTSLTCLTGKEGKVSCATVSLFPNVAARDAAIRQAMSYRDVPATVVAAANWMIGLCDPTIGREVAERLGGVLVQVP